jgi:hypothetical protein
MESQSKILKQKALAMLGEANVGFRKSEHRTKHSDKLVKDWKYVLYPMPVGERIINPEFRLLVEDLYDDVNVALRNGTIELNYTRALDVIERAKEMNISITVKHESVEEEDPELGILMNEVEKELKS